LSENYHKDIKIQNFVLTINRTS